MNEHLSLDYLDEERRKLWQRIESLEKIHAQIAELKNLFENFATKEDLDTLTREFDKKLPDHEREAKNASATVTRYRNQSEKHTKEVQLFVQEIESHQNNLNTLVSQLESLKTNQEKSVTLLEQTQARYSSLNACDTDAANLLELIKEFKSKAELRVEEIESSSKEWSAIVEEELPSIQLKIEAAQEKVNSDTKAIRKIYEEILGEGGLAEKLKSELDVARNNLNKLKKESKTALDAVKEEVEKVNETATEQYNALLKEKQDYYTTLKQQIESLLPDALTAGLASAYQAKREKEVEERNKSHQTFLWAIGVMTILALLPVLFNLWLLYGKNLEIIELITKIPSTVVLILPIYAPVLWLAYAANKRVNQSKRLIEEYAHKEALSKTFGGLSTQVKQLEDAGLSADLSVKLLYNVIKASAENPGELIKGFNKADNPIIDVLDKGIGFTESLKRLTEIPGFDHIIPLLQKAKANNSSIAGTAPNEKEGAKEESDEA